MFTNKYYTVFAFFLRRGSRSGSGLLTAVDDSICTNIQTIAVWPGVICARFLNVCRFPCDEGYIPNSGVILLNRKKPCNIKNNLKSVINAIGIMYIVWPVLITKST